MKNKADFFNKIEPSKTIPGRNDYWTSDGFYVEAVPSTNGCHWVVNSDGRSYSSAPPPTWVRDLDEAAWVIQAERNRWFKFLEETRFL